MFLSSLFIWLEHNSNIGAAIHTHEQAPDVQILLETYLLKTPVHRRHFQRSIFYLKR